MEDPSDPIPPLATSPSRGGADTNTVAAEIGYQTAEMGRPDPVVAAVLSAMEKERNISEECEAQEAAAEKAEKKGEETPAVLNVNGSDTCQTSNDPKEGATDRQLREGENNNGAKERQNDDDNDDHEADRAASDRDASEPQRRASSHQLSPLEAQRRLIQRVLDAEDSLIAKGKKLRHAYAALALATQRREDGETGNAAHDGIESNNKEEEEVTEASVRALKEALEADFVAAVEEAATIFGRFLAVGERTVAWHLLARIERTVALFDGSSDEKDTNEQRQRSDAAKKATAPYRLPTAARRSSSFLDRKYDEMCGQNAANSGKAAASTTPSADGYDLPFPPLLAPLGFPIVRAVKATVRELFRSYEQQQQTRTATRSDEGGDGVIAHHIARERVAKAGASASLAAATTDPYLRLQLRGGEDEHFPVAVSDALEWALRNSRPLNSGALRGSGTSSSSLGAASAALFSQRPLNVFAPRRSAAQQAARDTARSRDVPDHKGFGAAATYSSGGGGGGALRRTASASSVGKGSVGGGCPEARRPFRPSSAVAPIGHYAAPLRRSVASHRPATANAKGGSANAGCGQHVGGEDDNDDDTEADPLSHSRTLSHRRGSGSLLSNSHSHSAPALSGMDPIARPSSAAGFGCGGAGEDADKLLLSTNPKPSRYYGKAMFAPPKGAAGAVKRPHSAGLSIGGTKTVSAAPSPSSAGGAKRPPSVSSRIGDGAGAPLAPRPPTATSSRPSTAGNARANPLPRPPSVMKDEAMGSGIKADGASKGRQQQSDGRAVHRNSADSDAEAFVKDDDGEGDDAAIDAAFGFGIGAADGPLAAGARPPSAAAGGRPPSRATANTTPHPAPPAVASSRPSSGSLRNWRDPQTVEVFAAIDGSQAPDEGERSLVEFMGLATVPADVGGVHQQGPSSNSAILSDIAPVTVVTEPSELIPPFSHRPSVGGPEAGNGDECEEEDLMESIRRRVDAASDGLGHAAISSDKNTNSYYHPAQRYAREEREKGFAAGTMAPYISNRDRILACAARRFIARRRVERLRRAAERRCEVRAFLEEKEYWGQPMADDAADDLLAMAFFEKQTMAHTAKIEQVNLHFALRRRMARLLGIAGGAEAAEDEEARLVAEQLAAEAKAKEKDAYFSSKPLYAPFLSKFAEPTTATTAEAPPADDAKNAAKSGEISGEVYRNAQLEAWRFLSRGEAKQLDSTLIAKPSPSSSSSSRSPSSPKSRAARQSAKAPKSPTEMPEITGGKAKGWPTDKDTQHQRAAPAPTPPTQKKSHTVLYAGIDVRQKAAADGTTAAGAAATPHYSPERPMASDDPSVEPARAATSSSFTRGGVPAKKGGGKERPPVTYTRQAEPYLGSPMSPNSRAFEEEMRIATDAMADLRRAMGRQYY